MGCKSHHMWWWILDCHSVDMVSAHWDKVMSLHIRNGVRPTRPWGTQITCTNKIHFSNSGDPLILFINTPTSMEFSHQNRHVVAKYDFNESKPLFKIWTSEQCQSVYVREAVIAHQCNIYIIYIYTYIYTFKPSSSEFDTLLPAIPAAVWSWDGNRLSGNKEVRLYAFRGAS